MKNKFLRLTESLRQYRRAELKDFDQEIGSRSIDALYVDPLPDNAILNTVLSSNTTILMGRKGTGKSTIFAKAQSAIRKNNDIISIYIDVKALHGLVSAEDVPAKSIEGVEIDGAILQSHLLKKSFLNAILAEIIKELGGIVGKPRFYERWMGKNKQIDEAKDSLLKIVAKVNDGYLTKTIIPILQSIDEKSLSRRSEKDSGGGAIGCGTTLSPVSPSVSLSVSVEHFEEMINDDAFYEKYSSAIIQSFPYSELIDQVKQILGELSMSRVVIFFDDFSEIPWASQKLFVDTILSPLNNSSDETIKLKIAAYPGMVYYGSIDPGKIETVKLDFYDLYKAHTVQEMEKRSVDYTNRLILHRFKSFGIEFNDVFDEKTSIDEYMRSIFEASFNVPRIIGYILSYCYKDKVSYGEKITVASIRLAAQKYYEDVLRPYFDIKNRFVLEPFAAKIDRHNQLVLFSQLVNEAKNVRRKISIGEIGGSYFEGISNAPASHFSVYKSLEYMLAPLELNFLLTKYHEMRDKSGNDVSVFALYYGLTESERIPWGYPKGRRDDRSYFVQRCFAYNSVIHQFLASTQTIRCSACHQSFSMDKKDAFDMFGWICPECKSGHCNIVNLADEYIEDLMAVDNASMLEAVELDILDVLNSENKSMKASEISQLIDTTYQMVGKRTAKLQENDLVEKGQADGVMKSKITKRAKSIYFGSN
ncbi:hypothetical protein [Desulfocurvus sp. DL9XJH121]